MQRCRCQKIMGSPSRLSEPAVPFLQNTEPASFSAEPRPRPLLITPFVVSSTLVDIPGFGGVLLDAGEGTLGQMRRRFGTRGMAEEIYPNLRMVYISHMHADHHLGLRLVLEDRLKVRHRAILGTRGTDHSLRIRYSIIRSKRYTLWHHRISSCIWLRMA